MMIRALPGSQVRESRTWLLKLPPRVAMRGWVGGLKLVPVCRNGDW